MFEQNILDPAINLQHPDQTDARATVQEEAPPAEDASTAQAEPKLYAGKYKTPEELEKGYRNSAEETQKILARERGKDQELANLKMQLQERVNPGQQSAARKGPVDELTEAMVPVDALGAFIRDEVAKIFEPAARNMQARQAVTKEYTEFESLEGKLNEYLTANPDINERYQRALSAKDDSGNTDPAAAMEWLLLRYQRTNPQEQASDLSGQEQATARAVGALSNSAVGPRNTEPTFKEKLATANEAFSRTGNSAELLKIALVDSGFIDASHLK